jgi:hypothetical protein
MTGIALRSQSAFIERFGMANANSVKTIPADWLAAINRSANIGAVIGLDDNRYCQATFGSEMAYQTAAVIMAAATKFSSSAGNLRWEPTARYNRAAPPLCPCRGPPL